MGMFIEKWFGFSQIREELEARIGELENENAELLREKENLFVETSELKDANDQLRQKNNKLFITKDNLTKANAALTTENDKLFAENENLSVKISGLENSNDQLWQNNNKLTKEKAELKTEKDNLAKENTCLLAARDRLTEEKRGLTTEKERLKRENTDLAHKNTALTEKTDDLKTENDNLNHQVIALTNERGSLKQERAKLQDGHGFLEKRCADLEKDNQRLTDKLKQLESTQKNLENSNDQLRQALENANAQLAQAKEKIAIEKTELEREIARLKSLEGMGAKSDLDLHNRRLASANQDLKRQNRKLEEENIALKERVDGLKEQLSKPQKPQKGNIMVEERSLKLPLGHPLVEELCDRSLKDGVKFNEKSEPIFKDEVLEEDRIKFKQALRVLHAIANNSASSRYLSDDNQKFLEDLAQAKKIANEQIEKTLEIVSISDVDVDFEKFKKLMLNVDSVAVGLKSYSQSQLLDLGGGHWDLEAPSVPKERVTFRFDNLPKDRHNKEMDFYARSSLKDLKKGVVAIDFGTKSTTASYMDKNGEYRLLSIGGNVDDASLTKFENPTIVEFRYKEKFLKDYNALNHRPFTEKNDIEVAHEAQKNASGVKGNDLYRFFF
ncbi:M protein repeat protein [Helicobacter pylori GAM263BFi]|nr:M protein repeat protein [Helicobacter pylori GAM263BFi]